jgi:hypothetical protein
MQTQLLVPAEVLRAHLPPEVLISSGLCSECFTPLLLLHDGRWLCPKCKIEYDGNGENIEDDRVPFPQGKDAEKGYFESHFNPVNSLSFGCGLGTQNLIPLRAVARILSRENGNNEDLGVRSKIAKLIVERTEPEVLKKTLEHASQTLKLLGFGENMQISDSCGKIIRKAYAYLTLTSKGFTSKGLNSHVLADACVYFTLRKYGYEPNPPEKIEKGIVKTNVLRFPKWLLPVLRLLDSPAY